MKSITIVKDKQIWCGVTFSALAPAGIITMSLVTIITAEGIGQSLYSNFPVWPGSWIIFLLSLSLIGLRREFLVNASLSRLAIKYKFFGISCGEAMFDAECQFNSVSVSRNCKAGRWEVSIEDRQGYQLHLFTCSSRRRAQRICDLFFVDGKLRSIAKAGATATQ